MRTHGEHGDRRDHPEELDRGEEDRHDLLRVGVRPQVRVVQQSPQCFAPLDAQPAFPIIGIGAHDLEAEAAGILRYRIGLVLGRVAGVDGPDSVCFTARQLDMELGNQGVNLPLGLLEVGPADPEAGARAAAGRGRGGVALAPASGSALASDNHRRQDA